MWDKLSIKEKADIISLGVKNNINNLEDIKNIYNESTEDDYNKWVEAIENYKGIHIKDDPDYDYKGFYNENPNYAWSMLNKEAKAHFSDKYKTASHPTFSKESIYSGYKNIFNPKGITGGTWHDNNNYQLSEDQINIDWDIDRTLEYIKEVENDIVNVLAPDNSVLLPTVTVTPLTSKLNAMKNKKNKK